MQLSLPLRMGFRNANIIVIHLVGWLLFFTLILGFTVSMGHERQPIHVSTFPYLVFFSIYIALFYVNAGFLFPKLYLKNHHLLYFIVIIVLLATVMIIQPFDDLMSMHRLGPRPPDGPAHFSRRPGPPPRRNIHIDLVSIILFIMAWISSSMLHIIREWRSTQERAARAEAEKTQAELSFLKSQINPHFLFNTLNNIYSMAVTKNEHTAESVMKLSNIMRYVTDEVSQHFVPLENELNCVRDYIDLQRMRLDDKTEVLFSVTGDSGAVRIAPLLLMTYIENVFKYGISSHEQSQITIRIDITKDRIRFFCQNKIFTTERKTERTGIGLLNTQQRLRQLYPGKHSLVISTDNNFYTVELILE